MSQELSTKSIWQETGLPKTCVSCNIKYQIGCCGQRIMTLGCDHEYWDSLSKSERKNVVLVMNIQHTEMKLERDARENLEAKEERQRTRITSDV